MLLPKQLLKPHADCAIHLKDAFQHHGSTKVVSVVNYGKFEHSSALNEMIGVASVDINAFMIGE